MLERVDHVWDAAPAAVKHSDVLAERLFQYAEQESKFRQNAASVLQDIAKTIIAESMPQFTLISEEKEQQDVRLKAREILGKQKRTEADVFPIGWIHKKGDKSGLAICLVEETYLKNCVGVHGEGEFADNSVDLTLCIFRLARSEVPTRVLPMLGFETKLNPPTDGGVEQAAVYGAHLIAQRAPDALYGRHLCCQGCGAQRIF